MQESDVPTEKELLRTLTFSAYDLQMLRIQMGLRLCANICDPTTSEVSPLTVYSPADVHFAGFTPGLSVPDVTAMYIVPSAACKGKPPTATQSNNTRSMIILYAVEQEDSKLQQRCAQL